MAVQAPGSPKQQPMEIFLKFLMTGRAISFSVYRDTTVHVRNCMTSPCRAAEHEVRSKRAVACFATVCGDISGLVDLLDMVYMFTKLSDRYVWLAGICRDGSRQGGHSA